MSDRPTAAFSPRSLLFTAACAMGVAAAGALAQGAAPTQDSAAAAQQENTAPAQSTDERRDEAVFGSGAKAELTLGADHAFSSDLEDDAGSFSLTRGAVGINASFRATEKARVGFSVSGDQFWYSFDDATAFGAGVDQPWDDVRVLAVGASFTNQAWDTWGYRASASVVSSGEEGSEFSDTLTYAGSLGFFHTPREGLTLGLGVAVSSRLEDDATVLPIPFIRWEFNERWSLSTDARGSRSGGLTLAYKQSDEWTYFATASVFGEEFRLDADNAAAPEGVGQHFGIPVAVGASWTFHPQVTLTGRAGYVFGQTLQLDDMDGIELADVDADGAPFVGLVLTARF
ncbi:MAG TPA: hypothetical protein VD971_07430 [Phycisphaerales bacterium]|nr:hypothetical protein [Phycisphaerales bacterium]